jgi:hypothetical protein
MAVALHRIFVAILCIGIALSAVDALGLLCEYDCASEIEQSHGHQIANLNSSHVELDQHHHLTTSEFEFAARSSHSDTDCSSLSALVLATGTAPDPPSAGRAGIDLASPETSSEPSNGHFSVAVCGSPPLASNFSLRSSAVSLRI